MGEWQFTSQTIIVDPLIGYPAKLDVQLLYIHNNRVACFDDITLIETTDTVDYTYDNEGRVIKSLNGNGYERQTVTYYDESDAEQGGEIESITYFDGSRVDYNYTNHRQSFMMKWDAAGNYIYDECYLFDNYGNVEYAIQSSQEGYSNWTGYTYSTNSAIFGKLLTEEDVTGLVTTYHYDTATRYLMAVTTSDGTGTAYTYDNLGRQLSARPATVTSSGGYQAESGSEQAIFTYTENALSTVTTGSTAYTFTYDAYKNRQSVKVGSGNIAYYIYNAKNGKLIYTVYANGYVTKNVYDALDRIAKVCYIEIEGTPPTTASAFDSYQFDELTSYRYDEAGNVTEIIDHVNDEKTAYSYDTNGKPIQAVRFSSISGTVTANFSQSVTYNSVGLTSSVYEYYILNGTKQSNIFNYAYDSQQRLKTMYYGGTASSNKYTYTYDGLSRVTDRTLKYSGLTVSQAFTYQEIENSINNNSTSRLESLTSTVGTTTTGYSYTYDDRGNITHIYIGGVLKYSYAYDNLNQLVRENNAVANKTYVYTYDDAGNILTKKTYAYTTGTLGSVQSTYSYTYGNSNWGDQLTAYRGTSLTYDSLGNPLSYYNGASFTFT